jgi:hypothetical protein
MTGWTNRSCCRQMRTLAVMLRLLLSSQRPAAALMTTGVQDVLL